LISKKCYSEWETLTDGLPHEYLLGPLLFLLYINDVPNVISDISNAVLYADDTSLIIINSDSQRFEKDTNTAILQLNRWFSSKLLLLLLLLLLNLEKAYFLQFLTKNTNETVLHISYDNRQISSIHSTKFLGLVIDNNLSWLCHIDQMIPKLNKASYDVYYQTYLNIIRASLCPSSGEQDGVLLRMVFYTVTRGGKTVRCESRSVFEWSN